MSWSFSQGLVGEYLGRSSLDTVPSAQLNMTHTPDQYYWPDKPTEHSRISRFGMTCEPLTGNRGAELLTLYLEDSRARTYPLQEEAMDWTENVVDSGGRWRESLARYDQDTHSLKTAQLSLVEDWTGCSVTLPRSGLMLDGQCWELPTLGRITKGIESGFLPTPVATDAGSGRFNTSIGGKPRPTLALMARKQLWPTPKASDDKKARGNALENAKATQARGFSLSLPEMVAMRMWPTPTVCGNYNRKGASKTSGDGLATAVKMWPTPQASDNRDRGNLSTPAIKRRVEIGKQVSLSMCVSSQNGRLNPQWVEWLMGWPIGHTDLKRLATDKCPNAVPQPTVCSEVSE